MDVRYAPPQFRVFGKTHIETLPQLQTLDPEHRLQMRAVAEVLPFRVNNYVIDHLIDWNDIPNDPVYQLTFPQPGMLDERDLRTMRDLLARSAPADHVADMAKRIRLKLNPHPAGQKDLNVPRTAEGKPVPGMQHKYRETVLFFPLAGQTCHSYCTYCFRWPQFVGMDDMKFASKEAGALVDYLREHTEVTSVLFTGGDPMVMRTELLEQYIGPLLEADLPNIASIRIGTKAPAYWPYRFTQGEDADRFLRLIERVRQSGRDMALMAHFSVKRELETDVARLAVQRLVNAGATVRCQAPLIRHVNDNAENWRDMWRMQVRLGAIPYYMFVERDTGARGYFEVPLAEAYDIFTRAYSQVTGLARTVRGPSMSCTPGKVMVDGIADVNGEKLFVLKMLQARDPAWVNRVFFARFDPRAAWMDQLRPTLGEAEFFFEAGLRRMQEAGSGQVWREPSLRVA
ncbi:MAG: lysine 2,3-aminomutase [Planctomycetes bacterium]|nr:lysine 2,3-aminomutase [Planctomycetota bacterium]MCL4729686.1 lysine 2,3-aminomutase [Planctomycetota bacterium]